MSSGSIPPLQLDLKTAAQCGQAEAPDLQRVGSGERGREGIVPGLPQSREMAAGNDRRQ